MAMKWMDHVTIQIMQKKTASPRSTNCSTGFSNSVDTIFGVVDATPGRKEDVNRAPLIALINGGEIFQFFLRFFFSS